MNYIFYDFETTGRSSTWDQIIQVGFVLVNDTLEILDRFEARCALKPGVIPSPEALLKNNTSTSMLKKANLSHYKMLQLIKDNLKKPGWNPGVFIGYNSITFDEEFLRKAFFKSLHDIYLTNTNGNKRGDVLGLVRSAHLYYPDCIKTPISDKGNPVFKLDQIATMNGISHDNKHDAMGDVLATIGMAKLVSEKAPSVWNSSLKTFSKQDVIKHIKDENLFCTNEYFYGKARPFVVTYVCDHPKYQYPQCFDLKNDPEDYFNMDMSILKEAMRKSPKILRSLKHNKHPIIMSPNYALNFDNYKQIGLNILNERAEKIKQNKEFANKVSRILLEEFQEKEDMDSQLDILAEESIYKRGLNIDPKTKQAMNEFHKAEWKDKLSIADKIKDETFNYFAKILIYEEMPDMLPKDLYNEIHRGFANRVLSKDLDAKWNTIDKAFKEVDDLRAKHEDNKEKLDFLEDVNTFLMEIAKEYKDA